MMEADREYFGRVMSLVYLAWGGQGLTSLPIGMLADAIGERAVLAIEGILSIIIVVMLGFGFAKIGREQPASQPIQSIQ